MPKKLSSRDRWRRAERAKRLKDPERQAKLRAKGRWLTELRKAKLAAMSPEERQTWYEARAAKAHAARQARRAARKAGEVKQYGSELQRGFILLPEHLWTRLSELGASTGLGRQAIIRSVLTLYIYTREEHG